MQLTHQRFRVKMSKHEGMFDCQSFVFWFLSNPHPPIIQIGVIVIIKIGNFECLFRLGRALPNTLHGISFNPHTGWCYFTDQNTEIQEDSVTFSSLENWKVKEEEYKLRHCLQSPYRQPVCIFHKGCISPLWTLFSSFTK